MAMRKLGTAKATMDTACSTVSSQPPRTAATTPRVTLTTTVSTVAASTRDSETGSAVPTMLVTGWRLNQEAPRSPCTAPLSQSA
jgi:hypothetical protein